MSNTPKKPIKSLKKQLKDYARKVNAKCCYCGRSFDEKRKISLDHVIPKSSGGNTFLNNLLICCTPCNNVKKKSLSLEEFIRLNPKVKLFLKKYIQKMKGCAINGSDYYEEVKYIEELL